MPAPHLPPLQTSWLLALLPLLPLALALALAAQATTPPSRRRLAPGLALLLTLQAAALGQLYLTPEAHLVLPLGRYLQLHTLQINATLLLTRPAAWALLSLGALLYLTLRTAPSRAPQALLLQAATTLALLADDLILRSVAWTSLTLSAAALAAPAARPHRPLRWGLRADGAFLLWAALAFWSLGGSFSVGHADQPFVPDEDPSVPLPQLHAQPPSAPAAPAGAAAIPVGPTLSLREARAQLTASTPDGHHPLAERLGNKLFLGGRLQTALLVLLALASLLRLAAGLAAAASRHLTPPTRVLLVGCSLAAALDVWARLGLE